MSEIKQDLQIFKGQSSDSKVNKILNEIEQVNKEIEDINPKSVTLNTNAKDPREIGKEGFFKDIQYAIQSKEGIRENNDKAGQSTSTQQFRGKYEIYINSQEKSSA